MMYCCFVPCHLHRGVLLVVGEDHCFLYYHFHLGFVLMTGTLSELCRGTALCVSFIKEGLLRAFFTNE